MLLDNIVTCAVKAKALPTNTAPVFIVIWVPAMIVPLKDVDVFKEHRLPTCQKMLAACAPPARMTCRKGAVVRLLAIWKMKTAFGFPLASRVRSPDDISNVLVDL